MNMVKQKFVKGFAGMLKPNLAFYVNQLYCLRVLATFWPKLVMIIFKRRNFFW